MTPYILPRLELAKLLNKTLKVNYNSQSLFIYLFLQKMINSSRKEQFSQNAIFVYFIADFLAEKFGLSESEAQDMNRELFRTYGSSLAGLRVIN